ncbi:response regulator transcription factor [Chromohalobacter canadensis]|uniref:Two component transcriptional regulator, winged helix family n=1 Tax=Chromohalobacter canadensis TaxID=141389 RepID=A0A285VTD3_9GAMM|nr:response regulator transcription factor [Chromohalobacter canadensis]MCT8467847.1 response regulator transcription factor [Chromohalobacter canadensis]MCT8470404.1 response regulator transcription factor [Chromohalobacter canadensis]MCT8498344.1 response regulator transcription factor [Chromohalobacter canadensis]SOC55871.1 two component transcriptional regulator, winged helix family [Chromohalobacter canadensis]
MTPDITPTLLLVEDDALLAGTLHDALALAGYRIETLEEGDSAHARLATPGHGYALVLLDLNLPGRGGLEILDAMRRHDRDTPVLILTARGAIEDRVTGLDLGADDYLAKPFALDELEARVRALLRRRQHDDSPQLHVGPLHFDGLAQRFTLSGTPLDLPPREQRLLAYLMRHAGEPVEKGHLLTHVFSGETLGDNAIEVYIHRLRRRLAESLLTLRTVRGLGYVLESETLEGESE